MMIKQKLFKFNLGTTFKNAQDFRDYIHNFYKFNRIFICRKKIAFIDIDMIINESEFGKKSYKKIDNDFKKENEKLLKVEKKLISEEKEILNQKNILSEDELNNKVRFKKEINDFQKKKIN